MDSLSKRDRLVLHSRCIRRRNTQYIGSLSWHIRGILRVFGDALRDAWMGWKNVIWVSLVLGYFWIMYVIAWAIWGTK